jgi:hypothetical protein
MTALIRDRIENRKSEVKLSDVCGESRSVVKRSDFLLTT